MPTRAARCRRDRAAPMPALADASAAPMRRRRPPPPRPRSGSSGSTHVHARPSGDSTDADRRVIALVRAARLRLHRAHRSQPGQRGRPARRRRAARGARAGERADRARRDRADAQPERLHPAGRRERQVPDPRQPARRRPARPRGKLEWAEPQDATSALAKYDAALDAAEAARRPRAAQPPAVVLGHDRRAARRARAPRVRGSSRSRTSQFAKWNAGDKDHPSIEALWDAALPQGVDAVGRRVRRRARLHGAQAASTPPAAAGSWSRRARDAAGDPRRARRRALLRVDRRRARRAPRSTAASSSSRSRASEPGTYTIEFIENGKRVDARRRRARATRALPATGYVRAVVTRDDGKQAWVQPARR